MSKKGKIKENKSKKEKVKRQVFSSDSSSDNDVSQEVCDDSSDVESDVEYFQYDSDINIEDFVVAQYATKKSLKHYVGQVKALNNDEFTVSFLKRLPANTFVFPEQVDEDVINITDIILKLPPPYISGSTARAAKHFVFSVDLSKYNITL